MHNALHNLPQMTSQKIDFKKEIAAYKAAKNRFDIVESPTRSATA